MKNKIIKKVISILSEYKFTESDYIISLQGPTIIFTKIGIEKYNSNLCIKADLMHTGIYIM